MAHYRCSVIIPANTLLPEDAYVNTFHAIADDDAGAQDFVDELETLYLALDGAFSSLVAETDAVIKAYSMSDPEPRVPRITHSFGPLDVSASTQILPPEVSMVVSFQGQPASGQPQARRRGRVYLPPMAGQLNTSTGRWTDANVLAVATIWDTFITACKAATTFDWVVWSEVNNSYVEVYNGWVDNEPDTQRRRGRKATYRAYFQ